MSDELALYVSASAWFEVCKRANLKCKRCGEMPWEEDVDDVLAGRVCAHCAAVEQRWDNE